MLRSTSLLLLLLSLLSFTSLITAQSSLPTPTLVSATNFVNTQASQVQLIYYVPTGCPSGFFFCSFNVVVDGGAPALLNSFTPGQLNYTWTLANPITSYGAGLHTFQIIVTAMFPASSLSSPSNSIQVNVQPPTQSTPPVINPNAGGIVGDPQFTGLRGQTYQVHGAPNEVFNLITDTDFQYNSRFVYLANGDCPSIDGKLVDTPCFTHPGTYLGELALQTSAGDRLYLKAGSSIDGFALVELNGESVDIDESTDLKSLTGRSQPFLVRNSSHTVTVQMGNFWLELTNSDLFINQRVAMLDSSSQTSHGLLGQTWSGQIYDVDASIPWIEGTVWDYAMADHELFSHRFVFNRFVDDEVDEEEELRVSLKKLLKGGRGRKHSHAHKRGEDM